MAVAAPEMAPVFTEMPLERYRAELKHIGVTTHPTLIIYRAGPRSIEMVGSQSGFQSVREAFGWLDSIGVLRSKSALQRARLAQASTDSLRTPPSQTDTCRGTELARRDRDPELELTGGHPPHQSGQLPSGQAPYPSEQGGPPMMPPPMCSAAQVLRHIHHRPTRRLSVSYPPAQHSGSGDGNGLDPGRGLSSPGSRGSSATGSDDRGRPDSPAKYHLRGAPSVRANAFLHGARGCPGRKRTNS